MSNHPEAGQQSRMFSGTWHVVRTKPKQELLADLHLRRQGFLVYLPMYLHRSKRNGEWKTIYSPWFPGYLFLATRDADLGFTVVRSTRGVLSLVRFGNRVGEVSSVFLNQLYAIEQQQHQSQTKQQPIFQVGDRVLIDSGPLQGQTAVVSSCSQQRVGVLLTMLGRRVKAQLAIASVAPKTH